MFNGIIFNTGVVKSIVENKKYNNWDTVQFEIFK